METYNPIFTQVECSGEIYDCPTTEHEWLYPERFIGNNIVWFFANHIKIDDFVAPETINKFFHIWDNWKMLTHILDVSTGHEYLTTIDNCRNHITDLSLQEPLIRQLLYRNNAGVYDIFVKMTKEPNLRMIRHNIWTLLK